MLVFAEKLKIYIICSYKYFKFLEPLIPWRCCWKCVRKWFDVGFWLPEYVLDDSKTLNYTH